MLTVLGLHLTLSLSLSLSLLTGGLRDWHTTTKVRTLTLTSHLHLHLLALSLPLPLYLTLTLSNLARPRVRAHTDPLHRLGHKRVGHWKLRRRKQR